MLACLLTRSSLCMTVFLEPVGSLRPMQSSESARVSDAAAARSLRAFSAPMLDMCMALVVCTRLVTLAARRRDKAHPSVSIHGIRGMAVFMSLCKQARHLRNPYFVALSLTLARVGYGVAGTRQVRCCLSVCAQVNSKGHVRNECGQVRRSSLPHDRHMISPKALASPA
jgi:hypothetical protein